MVFAGNGVSDILSTLLLAGLRPTATAGIADLAHSRIGGDASTLALLLRRTASGEITGLVLIAPLYVLVGPEVMFAAGGIVVFLAAVAAAAAVSAATRRAVAAG